MAKYDCVSLEAERIFIDCLGTWNGNRRSPFLKKEWIKKYIEAHKNSTEEHHQAGVAYAKRKLAGMKKGKNN